MKPGINQHPIFGINHEMHVSHDGAWHPSQASGYGPFGGFFLTGAWNRSNSPERNR